MARIAVVFSAEPPARVRWGRCDASCGPVTIGVTDDGAVCRVGFGEPTALLLNAWRRHWPGAVFTEDAAAAMFVAEALASQAAVTVRLSGTEFQREVWKALLDIPAGQVVTYALLAQRIGRPMAARAVGSALGANPVPILVPCHRVIASDGSLGGFGGGLAVKRLLLAGEGVAIQ